MVILILAVIFQLCVKNYIHAQKFRMDYMYSHTIKMFYRLHDLATIWDQARQICEAEGTSLLVPDSFEEVENLKLLMSNMRAHYTALFIGLHDKFADGYYVNLKGQPIAGTTLDLLWTEGSPDNNGTKNCVVLTREGLFDDRSCNEIYPFICKIAGSDVRHNPKCNNYDLGYSPGNNGKCYKIHVEPLTWHDAFLVCKSEEGSLAIINSPDEATLITSFLSEHLHDNVPDPNILYIGFSDLMFPYQYRTVKGQSLEEAGYSSWSHAQEDPSDMELKHCGAISRTGFLKITWCDRPAMFLCERPFNKTGK